MLLANHSAPYFQGQNRTGIQQFKRFWPRRTNTHELIYNIKKQITSIQRFFGILWSHFTKKISLIMRVPWCQASHHQWRDVPAGCGLLRCRLRAAHRPVAERTTFGWVFDGTSTAKYMVFIREHLLGNIWNSREKPGKLWEHLQETMVFPVKHGFIWNDSKEHRQETHGIRMEFISPTCFPLRHPMDGKTRHEESDLCNPTQAAMAVKESAGQTLNGRELRECKALMCWSKWICFVKE